LQADDLDFPITGPKRNAAKVKPAALTQLGAYEVHTWPQGFSNIRHTASGETMHASTPPEVEAQRLYVEQSRLGERLKAKDSSPLVIWDVGLGAAANAMMAIQCYERQAAEGIAQRPLHVVSFENDLDSLKLAFRRSELFTYLRHGAPAAILESRRWQSPQFPGLSWECREGDFLANLELDSLPRPDLIFYDMFSFKTQAHEWSVDAFRRILQACGDHPTELLTYSASTGVRVALLAAGFCVARGASTGDKEETTLAGTPAARRLYADSRAWLAADWLVRWNRSGAKFPADLPLEQQPSFEKLILEHEQFVLAHAD
jgi:queuine tRNA-ribosyltransferase